MGVINCGDYFVLTRSLLVRTSDSELLSFLALWDFKACLEFRCFCILLRFNLDFGNLMAFGASCLDAPRGPADATLVSYRYQALNLSLGLLSRFPDRSNWFWILEYPVSIEHDLKQNGRNKTRELSHIT